MRYRVGSRAADEVRGDGLLPEASCPGRGDLRIRFDLGTMWTSYALPSPTCASVRAEHSAARHADKQYWPPTVSRSSCATY